MQFNYLIKMVDRFNKQSYDVKEERHKYECV